MRITTGYVCEANVISDRDAVVVQTLRQAGAIIYVKTTMPQTGMVSSITHGR
jgi:amidase